MFPLRPFKRPCRMTSPIVKEKTQLKPQHTTQHHPAMLSRIANATRVVARSTATRTFCAPTAAALKSASSSRQSNQHNRTHYNSNNSRHSFRFAGGVIALLSGGIVVAACDKSAEPNPSVNYSQLRQELEDLLEKEGTTITHPSTSTMRKHANTRTQREREKHTMTQPKTTRIVFRIVPVRRVIQRVGVTVAHVCVCRSLGCC